LYDCLRIEEGGMDISFPFNICIVSLYFVTVRGYANCLNSICKFEAEV
jgi:hypothetical protein